jgi:hypothetical protein
MVVARARHTNCQPYQRGVPARPPPPFFVFDRQILAALVVAMDKAICRSGFIKRVLQRVQDKLGLLRFGCTPPNDLVGKCIDNKALLG